MSSIATKDEELLAILPRLNCKALVGPNHWWSICAMSRCLAWQELNDTSPHPTSPRSLAKMEPGLLWMSYMSEA